jgi:predicted dehydrogenase
MTAARPRSVIVGAGLMGMWHAHSVVRLGGRVTAVVDQDAARASRLAQRFGAPRVFRDLPSLLAAGSRDSVHLCTPVDSHGDLIRAALEAGVPVLAEKPLARSAAEVRTLLQLAADRGTLLIPVHQFVFQEGFQKLLELLPDLGRVRHIDFHAVSAGADPGSLAERAAVAADILPHPLSLLARLLEEPVDLIRWHVASPEPGEVRATATCNRVCAGILVSMTGRPTGTGLRLIADAGTVHLDLFHGFLVRERGAVSRSRKILRPFRQASGTLYAAAWNLARRAVLREPAYPGLRTLIDRFHLAVQGQLPAPFEADEILAIARARDHLLAGLGGAECQGALAGGGQ